MSETIAFSVVVPAYNGAAHLADTLGCILAQEHPPAEVIVVDDGSSDCTAQVAQGFGARVRCITTDNQGVQAARNTGIAATTTAWIALCDQDDLWMPGHLAAHAALIDAAPEIAFSFGNFRILDDRPRAPGQAAPTALDKFAQAPDWFWPATNRRELPQGWVFDQPIAGLTFRFHPIFPSATVVSRTLLTRIGAFDTAMRGRTNEDGEFILRCLYDSVVGAIPQPLVLIRRHGGNFSADIVRNLMDEVRTLGWIRDHHSQAAPFAEVINAEISMRSAAALDAAFAAQDHEKVRQITREFNSLPVGLKPRLKQEIAKLPDFLGLPLNRLLQRISSGTVSTATDRIR